MQELKQKINQISYEVNASHNLLVRTCQDLKNCEDQVSLLSASCEVLKVIGDRKKQKTIEVFERVVTSAILEVFGFNYQFKIDINSEGKRILTKFKLINTDGKELDIMDSCGGGLIDVISFVLRVLILVSIKPRRQRIIYLDETFKHVSVDYRPKVASLLKSLAKQLNIQFLLVSHQPELVEAADTAYELQKSKDGVTLRRL